MRRRDVGARHQFDAPLIDLVARALASPMSRRRAVTVAAGAMLASTGLRPGRARGDSRVCPPMSDPLSTKKCQGPGGQSVCVSPEMPCCSSDVCGGACGYSWHRCSGDGTNGAACNDSPAMCTHPMGPGGGNLIKFCSTTVHVPKGACTNGTDAVKGWCCRGGEVCGREIGDCTCQGTVCGQYLCCPPDEVCETSFFGNRTACVNKCPDGKKPCKGKGDCCTGDLVCTVNGCDCPPGLVQAGLGNCVSPKETPKDIPFWQSFLNMIHMGARTSATHGGSSPRALFARPAQSGSPAVDAALVALAAVDGQGAAAVMAFAQGKRDPAFRRKVGVVAVRPPVVAAGPGLDAASAAALTKLLAAEAKAYALLAASAKALWRSRAAKAKGQRAFAKSQLRASSKFAGQAASALKRVPALRTAAARALTAGGVAEVTPTEEQVAAFLAAVKAGGIPAYLRGPLGAVGVAGSDLKHVRALLLRQTVSLLATPALIAPLSDAAQARDLKQMISELSAFSTRARKHPVAR